MLRSRFAGRILWGMSTHASPVPDPIRDSIRVLAAYRNKTQAEVIIGTGIPKSTFIRRMHGGGWTVSEVRALAAFLGVEPRMLLDGPDALFQAAGVSMTTSGWSGRSRQPIPTPRVPLAA